MGARLFWSQSETDTGYGGGVGGPGDAESVCGFELSCAFFGVMVGTFLSLFSFFFYFQRMFLSLSRSGHASPTVLILDDSSLAATSRATVIYSMFHASMEHSKKNYWPITPIVSL